MTEKRKPGLGRGLTALLDDARTNDAPRAIPVASISANALQPRRRFDQAAIDELTDSIQVHGVLQPILVRPLGGGRYEVVAGERRWRAAQAARLHEIPALVREYSPTQALEVAIVENVQRADLNPIEEAASYRRLIDEFDHGVEDVARLVGKSRSHVANLMRLLELPDVVREHVVEGRLTMGHARALLAADAPITLAEKVVVEGLSVRETEALASPRIDPREMARALKKMAPARDPDVEAVEKTLADALGLAVTVVVSGRGGQVTVKYSTLDQLDMVCKRLTGGRI